MVNINGELMISVNDIMVVLSVLYLLGIVIVGIGCIVDKIWDFFIHKPTINSSRDKSSCHDNK